MPQVIAAFQNTITRITSVAKRTVKRFARRDEGAVTVDWVVLTAAVVALNMVFLFTPAREAVMNVVAEIGISLGFVSETMRSAGSMGEDI